MNPAAPRLWHGSILAWNLSQEAIVRRGRTSAGWGLIASEAIVPLSPPGVTWELLVTVHETRPAPVPPRRARGDPTTGVAPVPGWHGMGVARVSTWH